MRNLLKFITTRRIASVVAGVALVGMLLGGNVGTAFATDPTGDGTFTIGGGTLLDTMGAIVVNGGSTVTLNGADQNVSIALPVTVNDPTGTGNGWNVTIKADLFSTTGAAYTLPNSPIVTGVTPTAVTGSNPTVPTDSHADTRYSNFTVPVSTATAIPLFSADANTGQGEFLLTPAMTMSIPASSHTGDYTSTFTVGIVSGPHS